jgi:hypothetical protein
MKRHVNTPSVMPTPVRIRLTGLTGPTDPTGPTPPKKV